MKKTIARKQIHFSLHLLGQLVVLLATLFSVKAAYAQSDADQDELNIIEVELDKAAPKKQAVSPKANPNLPEKNQNIDFSGLGKLAPFKEISIIQKKFLPKTGRFQANVGASMVTNNPFFNSYGANVNLGYFFTETLGVELKYFTISSSESKATQELHANNNVTTDSIVSPKGYLGADLVYAPIYGKMTWFNNRIIPFDFYFSAGAGTTQVSQNSTTSDSSTIHLGTGQIFALTKAYAFRWDLSCMFYNAKQITKNGAPGDNSTFNDLYLTIGMSYFFPEAKYR